VVSAKFFAGALKESFDDHARRAADHALADTRNGAACVHIAGVSDDGASSNWRYLNVPFAINEAGIAAAGDRHAVVGGGMNVVKANGAVELAANSADAHRYGHFVRILACGNEFFAAGKAGCDAVWIRQRVPERIRCSLFEEEMSFKFHQKRRTGKSDLT